jgi:hypothetical protein
MHQVVQDNSFSRMQSVSSPQYQQQQTSQTLPPGMQLQAMQPHHTMASGKSPSPNLHAKQQQILHQRNSGQSHGSSQHSNTVPNVYSPPVMDTSASTIHGQNHHMHSTLIYHSDTNNQPTQTAITPGTMMMDGYEVNSSNEYSQHNNNLYDDSSIIGSATDL